MYKEKENVALIKKTSIIIDSKSGISGAGRNIKEALLFAENYNSISAYGDNNHRHIPEMEHLWMHYGM